MALSVQQQEVVNWAVNGQGHANVIAYAGTGKTFTLMALVDAVKAAKPQAEIFLGAYNKAIATELAEKIAPKGYGKSVQASTLHAAGFQALGSYLKSVKGIQKLNVEGKKIDLIVDSLRDQCVRAAARATTDQIAQEANEKAQICQNQRGFVTKAVSLAKQRAFGVVHPVDQMEKWYELIEHFGLDEDWDELEYKHSEAMIRLAITVYNLSIDQIAEGIIDFDDMILGPLFFRAKFWPKDFVLVDEAQDLNPARRILAIRMAGQTGRVVCAGEAVDGLIPWIRSVTSSAPSNCPSA